MTVSFAIERLMWRLREITQQLNDCKASLETLHSKEAKILESLRLLSVESVNPDIRLLILSDHGNITQETTDIWKAFEMNLVAHVGELVLIEYGVQKPNTANAAKHSHTDPHKQVRIGRLKSASLSLKILSDDTAQGCRPTLDVPRYMTIRDGQTFLPEKQPTVVEDNILFDSGDFHPGAPRLGTCIVSGCFYIGNDAVESALRDEYAIDGLDLRRLLEQKKAA